MVFIDCICLQQQELFLTSRVTHVVRDRVTETNSAGGAGAAGPARWARREGRARADAMLERVRPDPPHHTPNNKYIQISVQKVHPLIPHFIPPLQGASLMDNMWHYI